MSGEPFHHFKAAELDDLQEVLDLKMALCKAKGLQSAKMLRLFEEAEQAAEAESRTVFCGVLWFQELWRRQRRTLRALVVLPEDEDDELEKRLPVVLQHGLVSELKDSVLHVALQRRAQVMGKLPPELKGDRHLVLEAVTQNWRVLRFCQPNFQDDFDVVRQALLQNTEALQFASERLRGDQALASEALQLNTAVLQFLLREAVRWNPFALRFASSRLTNHKDLVMQAVRAEGLALLYAGKDMREDREVVLAAVKHTGSALVFASGELRSDREVVWEAVHQNGMALQHASDELQADLELLNEAGGQISFQADGIPPVTQPSFAQSRGDIVSSCGFMSPRPVRQGYPMPKTTVDCSKSPFCSTGEPTGEPSVVHAAMERHSVKYANFHNEPPALRPPKVPLKELILALVLFVVGTICLLSMPFNVLGGLCFIPGAYHSFIFLMVFKKVPGYSYDMIITYQ
eukprot:g23163.t1